MKPFTSGLYWGEVTHRRFTPKVHRLKYSMFQLLLDIDEIPTLDRRLRLFSYNRTNVFSHHDGDHGKGENAPLRHYVQEMLRYAGLPAPGGRIELLCMPRIFGFVFNPLSVYYCYDFSGILENVLFEVNNTFGQRHCYLFSVESNADGVVRQSCAKAFYVSPFMPMEMTYEFELTPPGDTLSTTVRARDAGGALVITAAFASRRREITDTVLLWALATYPFLTVGVMAAIHFEAAKLWIKGLRLKPRPPPPAKAVTVGHAAPTHVRPVGLHKTDKQSV